MSVIKRPFPWCMAPDWVWFSQGVISFILCGVPLTSAILTTLPSLALLQWLYHNFKPVQRVTDQARDMKRAISQAVANKIMLDPRNHDYLPWLFGCSVIPPVLLYWAWRRYQAYGLEIWVVLVYHHFRIGPRFRLFAHHHVLVHKEGHSHKGFFRGPFKCINQLSGMWTGLFYGTIPFHYSMAHNKIHHRWHNDCDDVHTNIDLDRTVFSSYVTYWPRFFYYWTGVSPMVLFLKRGEYGFAKVLGQGMTYYYCVGMLLCYKVGWQFAAAYWLYPLMESCTFLGMIAYLWHGFVEPSDPGNQYVNSITILNGGDNVWNEDYHVVHHHAVGVHWSDAPKHFEKHKDKYIECNASVFKDCEEGMMIHFIFGGLWDKLAEHFVDLSGKLSHEEKKELLLRRLRYTKGTEAASWINWGASKQRDWDLAHVGVTSAAPKEQHDTDKFQKTE